MRTVTNTVSVTPVVLERAWKANGTNFVRFRFCLRRETKLVKTNIAIHPEHYKKGKFMPPIKGVVDELVLETEKKLAELKTDALAQMTLDDVVKHLAASDEDKNAFKLDFFEFAQSVINEKTGQSKRTYTSALNALKAYVGEETMDISRITSSFMRAYPPVDKDDYRNWRRIDRSQEEEFGELVVRE